MAIVTTITIITSTLSVGRVRGEADLSGGRTATQVTGLQVCICLLSALCCLLSAVCCLSSGVIIITIITIIITITITIRRQWRRRLPR
jgi:hypothetical protein